jgi:uncharacterized protein (TIGR00304 family)
MFIKNVASFFALVDGGKRLDIAIFYVFGIALIVVGILVIAAATILSYRGSIKKNKVHGAGVIMIGPIPIIFGTDKKSVKAVLTLALALTIIVLIVIVLHYWLLR